MELEPTTPFLSLTKQGWKATVTAMDAFWCKAGLRFNMSTSSTTAIQDLYPDDFAHCFGCGRSNSSGHQLKSFSEGDEVVAHFTPEPHQMAVPGFVYGGLLASLVDCH